MRPAAPVANPYVVRVYVKGIEQMLCRFRFRFSLRPSTHPRDTIAH